MKTKLLTLTLSILCFHAVALAHDNVELGPNGGRILEFSKDETMHGEVTAKDGAFRVALLDKDMKPVAIEKQTLTATTGDRSKPQKLEVSVKDNAFIVPIQPGGDHWTIFQFKPAPDAKPITARLHYETKPCPECKKAEWLCECKTEGSKKTK